MVQYNCPTCSYTTKQKMDYTRHMQSKKHLTKVSQESIPQTIALPEFRPVSVPTADDKPHFQCESCRTKFTRLCNLTRHKKICIDSKYKNLEKESMLEKVKNENILEKVKMLEKEIERLNKRVEITESSSKPTNINNLTYITYNYSSAPPLKGLPSYAHILDADTMTLPEVLIMYHQQGTLCRFLGKFLVDTYSKKNAGEQSIWSSDTSRLTYIVNVLQESGKIKWVIDKKGIKVKECVINPLLSHLKMELIKYADENSFSVEIHIQLRLQAVREMYQLIDKELLANDIVKYMAPYFCLLKEDDKKETKIKQIEI